MLAEINSLLSSSNFYTKEIFHWDYIFHMQACAQMSFEFLKRCKVIFGDEQIIHIN